MITAKEAKEMANNALEENIKLTLEIIFSDIEYAAKKSHYKKTFYFRNWEQYTKELRAGVKKELRNKGYKIPISFFSDSFTVKW